MKYGNITLDGNLTTRAGTDTTNPEAPAGESFNITTGTSSTAAGGNINLTVGNGTTDGHIVLKTVSGSAAPILDFSVGSFLLSLSAPTLTANSQFIFPAANGTTGQFLYTSATGGQTSWKTLGASDINTALGSNAVTYSNALFTARSIAASGDATWSVTFDGSGNVSSPLTLATNVVSNTKFRQSAGLSLVGNSTNATANVADITATGANQVLMVNSAGTALTWSVPNLDSLSDVVVASPTTNQVLSYNGTTWANKTWVGTATSYSTTLSTWALVSGNLYSAAVAHNLGTNNVVVQIYDTATNTIVQPDKITILTTNIIVVQVTGNTHTLNVTVIANGLTMAPVATLSKTFTATALESPNNADWTINALAPVTNDPTYGSLLVRSFASGTETGVGLYLTIPAGSTSATFTFKGRAAAATTAVNVALRLYSRSFPNNAAAGAWSSAYALTTISIPSNALMQYNSVTVSLATLGVTAGNFYAFELTRSASDTLSGAFLLSEMGVLFS